MKASIATAFIAALAEAAVTGGKAFTLNQIVNKNFSGRDGVMAVLRAYMKYAQKPPQAVLKAVNANSELRIELSALHQSRGNSTVLRMGVSRTPEKVHPNTLALTFSQDIDVGQKGTVQALPAQDFDLEYAVVVDVGTPAQSIPLNLDTGSADLWILSSDTKASMVRGQKVYRPRQSFTSKRLGGESWAVHYGDGASASGIVYQDTVRMGDTQVKNQAIESAVRVSEDIADDNFVSGIMGMANSAANTVRPIPKRTYMDNIWSQLALPVFTANLRRRAPGNFNFGYINDSEHTGRVQYAPLDRSSPLWKIAATGYWVGHKPYRHRIHAIVDTGTSLALLPQSVVDNFYAQVTGAFVHPQLGLVVFPCTAELPDFWLRIGAYNGRLPGRYVNYAPVNGSHCSGGIQTSTGLPFSVLGDVFLKAQFVVFDHGNAAVGFANKNLRH
ncbi:hypothetical protein E4U41_006894 [Claviceps citrina]|nr:hypothetical protein E4U41_006894 [Claviceps citrina]